MQKITAYFDGATEPVNPGGAMGIGACVLVNDIRVFEHSTYVPMANSNSNNVAEYRAFESVLDFLICKGYTKTDVHIFGDSQLVIKQMAGIWRMRFGFYIPVATRCKEKLLQFEKGCVHLKWIPREQNTIADELSKRPMIENKVEFRIQPNEKKIV